MWYKNLRVYKFTEAQNYTAEQLAAALRERPFNPCSSHDKWSFGFVHPFSDSTDCILHNVAGNFAICGKKEVKVLPSSSINEELADRVKAIEEREARKLPAKERARMKDELIFEWLPRAFTQSTKTHAYIDARNGYLIVDAASATKAEDFLSHLRKALGSLPAVPLKGALQAAGVMTSWVSDQDLLLPGKFSIDDECELKSPEEEGAIIRCKHKDLSTPEVKTHLDLGMQVRKLALTYADRISFTLDTDLAIKRVKFLDLVQEKAAEIEAFDEQEQFEADFTIMAGELAELIHYIENAFSGEVMQ